MIAVLRMFPAKVWLGVGAVAAVLALYAGYRYQESRANRAIAEARQSNVTVGALDTVATKTTTINAETEEKSDAVEKIQGADTRLPDNFGRDLERVRRGERGSNP